LNLGNEILNTNELTILKSNAFFQFEKSFIGINKIICKTLDPIMA